MSICTASIFIGSLHPFESLPTTDALISVEEGDRVALTWRSLVEPTDPITWIPPSPETVTLAVLAMSAVSSGRSDASFGRGDFVQLDDEHLAELENLAASVAVNLPGMAFQIVKGDGSILDPTPFEELPNEVILYQETWRSSED